MKKEKKQKSVEDKFVLGKKIRDISLNERQHFLLFVSMLIFFNILLIFSVWFVLLKLNNQWYYWAICFGILLLCFWLSFKSYIDTKSFNKCALYDNALSVNSIWMNLTINLKDIYAMNVKETRLDKAFKLNTKSLEIKILNNRRKKFTIHFIEENAVKLKQEITMLIDKDSQKKTKDKKVPKTPKTPKAPKVPKAPKATRTPKTKELTQTIAQQKTSEN